MSLDATVGGASSNSYVTDLEAEAYFENHVLGGTTWSNYSNPEAALIHATTLLDNLVDWNGDKDTTTQSLDWPRTLEDTDVYDGIIPPEVKIATYELALYLIDSGSTVTDNSMESVEVGPIKLEFNLDKAPVMLPQLVSAIIANLGSVRPYQGSGVSTVDLVRV